MPCREAEAELVVMGGFLKHVLIPADFENRVINIHPSLIPAYCGKGFYGHRVHEAVLEAGEATSGCTIHFVDNEYDHGPIILQRQVVVEPEDTPESLAARVFEAECEAYPQVIAWIAAGQVSVEQGQVVVAVDFFAWIEIEFLCVVEPEGASRLRAEVPQYHLAHVRI